MNFIGLHFSLYLPYLEICLKVRNQYLSQKMGQVLKKKISHADWYPSVKSSSTLYSTRVY